MKTHKILGLMSGTSLDGLDLACCHLRQKKGLWEYELKETKSISYTPQWRNRLKDAIFLDGESLLLLHNEYGSWLGEQARNFVQERKLEVTHIASHGHTSHHQPQKGLTFQLGSGQHLATASGIPTVCDFRTLDVILGGQGAPLVPIGDRLFFGNFDFCLNLGGISNISFELNGNRIAYDIGLANMLLNHISRKTGLEYDENGALAGKGHLLPELFNRLNALEYYARPFPKSIGYEWFLSEVVPMIDATEAPVESLLHTSVHHLCEQVAVQLRTFRKRQKQSVLVTGGGALNGFLTKVLQERLGTDFEVVVPDRTLIEFKEALVFSLMGALRLEGQVNVLCSATGAKRDSSSGSLFLP